MQCIPQKQFTQVLFIFIYLYLHVYSGCVSNMKVDKNSWKKIILAYEPVWAIGTGETASAEQAQEMHEYVRKCISESFGKEISNNVSILYGGSVKPNNASEIFSKKDVDGGLIGGAALNASDFSKIVESNR